MGLVTQCYKSNTRMSEQNDGEQGKSLLCEYFKQRAFHSLGSRPGMSQAGCMRTETDHAMLAKAWLKVVNNEYFSW